MENFNLRWRPTLLGTFAHHDSANANPSHQAQLRIARRAPVLLQHVGLEVGMAVGVLLQVVAAHEALAAQRTREALLSGVSAGVAGEFVRAGKLLLAVRPGAWKGPLTCNMTNKAIRLLSHLSHSGEHP